MATSSTIRRRLGWILGLGMVVLLVLAGVFVGHRMQRHVTASFDETLLTQARALAALIEQEHGRVEFDYAPGVFPEYVREDEPHYFEVRVGDRVPPFRSRHLKVSLPWDTGQAVGSPIRDIGLPDGRAGRLVQLRFRPKPSLPEPGDDDEDEAGEATHEPVPDVVLLVARERESLNRLIAGMMRTIGLVGLALLALFAFLLWRALALGLRPLDDVVSQIQVIDADSLDQRIATQSVPRELSPVVQQFNALIARLEEALGRERRFTGNVAHELRTPIAELRTLAAVASRWPRDTMSVERFFGDVQEIAGGMETIISDLLLLARCDAGTEVVSTTAVPLVPAIETAWNKALARAHVDRPTLDPEFSLDADSSIVVHADESKLSIILGNIFDNAVAYARGRPSVHCVASIHDGALNLRIANPSDPLPSQDMTRVTEPFWRRDEARTVGDHAGLGLSLVVALAQLLRWHVSIHQESDSRFVVSIDGIQCASQCPDSSTHPMVSPVSARMRTFADGN